MKRKIERGGRVQEDESGINVEREGKWEVRKSKSGRREMKEGMKYDEEGEGSWGWPKGGKIKKDEDRGIERERDREGWMEDGRKGKKRGITPTRCAQPLSASGTTSNGLLAWSPNIFFLFQSPCYATHATRLPLLSSPSLFLYFSFAFSSPFLQNPPVIAHPALHKLTPPDLPRPLFPLSLAASVDLLNRVFFFFFSFFDEDCRFLNIFEPTLKVRKFVFFFFFYNFSEIPFFIGKNSFVC